MERAKIAVLADLGFSLLRIPAALCGIVGLKATHGRISLFGVTPLAWSLEGVVAILSRRKGSK